MIYNIPKFLICDDLSSTKRNLLYHTCSPQFYALLVKEEPTDGDFVNFRNDEYLKVVRWECPPGADRLSPLLNLKSELNRFLRVNPKRGLMPTKQADTLDKLRGRIERIKHFTGMNQKDIAIKCGYNPCTFSQVLNGRLPASKALTNALELLEIKTKRGE